MPSKPHQDCNSPSEEKPTCSHTPESTETSDPKVDDNFEAIRVIAALAHGSLVMVQQAMSEIALINNGPHKSE